MQVDYVVQGIKSREQQFWWEVSKIYFYFRTGNYLDTLNT